VHCLVVVLRESEHHEAPDRHICLPYALNSLKEVVEVDSLAPGQSVDLIVKPSIIKFNSVIPYPAYNPYTATIVYRVEVFDRNGEKIFAQTTTGEGQTSKGLMSGFMARGICAEVAQMAMGNAVQQILEGLSEAEELVNLK